MAVTHADDLRLIHDVVAVRPQAWEVLARRIADTVWTACLRLEAREADARTAFALVMGGLRADGFRRLREYNGSSRVETFVTLLTWEMRNWRQDDPMARHPAVRDWIRRCGWRHGWTVS